MERFKNAVIRICPILQISLFAAEILQQDEIVFQFKRSENVEPLLEMFKKYGINAQMDIVDNWKFLFINT